MLHKGINGVHRAVVLGLVAAFIAGVIIFTFSQQKPGASDNSVAVWVPIWLAVMIPIIAAKKKQGAKCTPQPMSGKERRLVYIILVFVGLMVLAAVATIFFNK